MSGGSMTYFYSDFDMHNSNAKEQIECDEKHILDKIVVNRRTAAIIAAHLADEIGETCCAKLLGIGIVEFRELEYDLQLEGIAAWDEYRRSHPPECNNINQKVIA